MGENNCAFNIRYYTYSKDIVSTKITKKYKYPYLSIDYLKVGLIRSKDTTLTVEAEKELTDYICRGEAYEISTFK